MAIREQIQELMIIEQKIHQQTTELKQITNILHALDKAIDFTEGEQELLEELALTALCEVVELGFKNHGGDYDLNGYRTRIQNRLKGYTKFAVKNDTKENDELQ